MFLGRVQSQPQYEAARLALLPSAWRGRVAKEHGRKFAAARSSDEVRNANLWLLDLTDRAAAIRVPVHLSDGELCDMARVKAAEAMGLVEIAPSAPKVPGVLLSIPDFRARLNGFVLRYGITPPEPRRLTKNGNWAGIEDRPAIARMTCHLWWRRRLRVAQGRAIEAEAVRLGYVHRRAEIYCSDLTHERRQQQRQRNAKALQNTLATNTETGDVFTLAELAEKSTASPRIRRGELMTRIAGFEAVAKGLGHVAEFGTLTAPSKYHAHRSGPNGKVEENPKYEGATPREGQKYLSKLWANARAALWRLGIRPYGFRIAEPHHDGCPHWHMLFFVAAEAVETLRAVIRKYALREDGDEAGAQKNRVKFVSIDPARGSAAGYIAKYVAKNIDGYQVQTDLYGNDAVTASGRVDAWASQWGIRQFQQIGGPPVGVWRELRRTEAEGLSDAVEAVRIAADVGNWGRYVEVMGGPLVKRIDLPVRLAMTRPGMRWNFTGQYEEDAPRTRYGDDAPAAVFGVLDVEKGRAYQSRRYRWEIRRKGNGIDGNAAARVSAGCRVGGSAPVSVAGLVGVPDQQKGGKPVLGFGFEAGAAGPWTRVNNCSQEVGNGGNEGRIQGNEGAGGDRRCSSGMASGAGSHSDGGGAMGWPDSGGADRAGGSGGG